MIYLQSKVTYMASDSDDQLVKNARENCGYLIKHMLSFCLNLVRFEDPKQPIEPCGLATGFLVSSGDRKFVLSAGHAARRNAAWFWETNVVLEVEREVLCIPIGPFTVLNSITVHPSDEAKISDIDFGWCDIDVAKLEKEFQKDARLKGCKLEFQFYQGPLDASPVPNDEPYTFAAWNRATIIPAGTTFLERSPAYETCMTFSGVNSDGLYVFNLARPHQGHSYYRGASGAPIAAPDGTIVSIVLGGNETKNEIHGLPLAKYSPLLQLA